MNIIINNGKMEIAASAKSLEQAVLLAKVLCGNQDFCVVGHQVKHYSIYTEMELSLLLKSVGVEAASQQDRNTLIARLIEACEKLQVDETPVSELREKLGLATDEMPAIDFTQPKSQPAERKASGEHATANINRPKAGTATGKVWDIIDGLKKGTSMPAKADVLAAGVAEGLNEATISTQYSKYRRWFLEQNN